jgi:hypothetical protein
MAPRSLQGWDGQISSAPQLTHVPQHARSTGPR